MTCCSINWCHCCTGWLFFTTWAHCRSHCCTPLFCGATEWQRWHCSIAVALPQQVPQTTCYSIDQCITTVDCFLPCEHTVEAVVAHIFFVEQQSDRQHCSIAVASLQQVPQTTCCGINWCHGHTDWLFVPCEHAVEAIVTHIFFAEQQSDRWCCSNVVALPQQVPWMTCCGIDWCHCCTGWLFSPASTLKKQLLHTSFLWSNAAV